MTAVDHAEPGRTTYEANSKQFDIHPFFCRAAEWDDLPADTKAHYTMVERTVRAPLLSEIEGLKAERAETENRTSEYFVAMREAQTNAAVYKHDKLEAERQLAALRTQAPDSWRPSNAEVDNILWACEHSEAGIKRHGLPASEAEVPVSTEWLRKACAALRPQTAESGK